MLCSNAAPTVGLQPQRIKLKRRDQLQQIIHMCNVIAEAYVSKTLALNIYVSSNCFKALSLNKKEHTQIHTDYPHTHVHVLHMCTDSDRNTSQYKQV